MSKRLKTLTNGILNENPVLRLVLCTCPTLAVTTMASNGIGMGLAATFVLLCSNIVISALRKVIPDGVRIPSYIVIVASLVSMVEAMTERRPLYTRTDAPAMTVSLMASTLLAIMEMVWLTVFLLG